MVKMKKIKKQNKKEIEHSPYFPLALINYTKSNIIKFLIFIIVILLALSLLLR